jgi:methylmalonyl-CoA/ethylmalonyl-CoA epimerase
VNKADRPGADRVERELEAMLALAETPARKPAVARTVATEGTGVAGLLALIEEVATLPKAGATSPQQFAIDHVGIAVPVLDQALAFYGDQLGLTVVRREAVGSARVRSAMLPASNGRIELLEAGEEVATVHHVALRVTDVATCVERLRAGGAKVWNEACPASPGPPHTFVDAGSGGGVLLELIEDRGPAEPRV